MNLPRYLSVLVLLAFAACVMTCGVVSAQEGGRSLPELSAQAQKIKVGEATEADVISLLGQPSKSSEFAKTRGGAREIMDLKKLFYGPENNIVVVIDNSTGKVKKVNIKPAR